MENENTSENNSDSIEEWEELLENDEISPEEEGFLIGWMNAVDTGDQKSFSDEWNLLTLEELDKYLERLMKKI